MEKDFFTIELPEKDSESIEEFSKAQKRKKNNQNAKANRKRKRRKLDESKASSRKQAEKDEPKKRHHISRKNSQNIDDVDEDEFEQMLRENGIESYDIDKDTFHDENFTDVKSLEREPRPKKKSRAKKIFHIRLGVIFGTIATIAIAFVLVVLLFRVKDVEVVENTIVSDATVEKYVLDDKYCVNGCYVVLKNYFKPHRDIPFTDSVRVSLKNRNTVLVTVNERYPAGYYVTKSKKYAYFNDEGIVTDVSKTFVESVWLTNTITKKTTTGKEIPLDEGQAQIVSSLCKLTKEYDINPDAITIKDDSNIFIIKDNIIIALGTRANLNEKIKRLPYVLPHLENKSGTLHLENWTAENTDIVFKELEEN